MKRLVIAAMLFFAGNASAATWCDAYDTVVDFSSTQLANYMECNNVDAVKADIGAMADSLGICKKSNFAPVDLCPYAASIIVDVLGAQVPAKWDCKLEKASAHAKYAIETLCKQVL